MSARTLYIRDVPEDLHATIRTRAAAEGMSVAAYVLRLLQDEMSQPTVGEVFSRRREPVRLTDDDILSAIHTGRR